MGFLNSCPLCLSVSITLSVSRSLALFFPLSLSFRSAVLRRKSPSPGLFRVEGRSDSTSFWRGPTLLLGTTHFPRALKPFLPLPPVLLSVEVSLCLSRPVPTAFDQHGAEPASPKDGGVHSTQGAA